MTTTRVALPDKLIPVFRGRADVRGAYGGRGSGKTRTFAKMIAVRGMVYGRQNISGQLLCARQFMNSLDDSSLEECKRAIEEEWFLKDYYDIGEKYIKSKDGLIWFSFAGLDRNINSVKSKGRILICWVDEAEPVTDEAWNILGPTLREEGSDWNAELWVTWNPKRKNAAVESRFRFANDPLIKVVQINWRDNARFPDRLERERQRDLIHRPDQYAHIWEGDYISVNSGAYFSKQLIQAKQEGRITRVPTDPLLTVHVFCDIGGTGARSDAFAMWAVQIIGKEIRVLNYYESVGQEIGAHINWLRSNSYTPERTHVWLPHDGAASDKVFAVSYESAFRKAGYKTSVEPNQGRGAASIRIEAVRRFLPYCWFNEATTEPGREALGWYHEKKDETRDIGLGPEHDWSSHGSDAFGLACCVAERLMSRTPNKIPRHEFADVAGGWMS
jgi:phage terminase large subunit